MATYGYDEEREDVSRFQAEVDRLVMDIESRGFAVDLSHEPGATYSVTGSRGATRDVVLPPMWFAKAVPVPATRMPGPKPQEGRTILEALQRLKAVVE